MKPNNTHKFNTFYKDGNRKIIKFLDTYVFIYGITVARILANEVNNRYGVIYTPAWINVILKSAKIPSASRKDRGKKKQNKKFNPAYLQPLLSFHNCPGLLLFDYLFMRGTPNFDQYLSNLLFTGHIK